MAPACGRTFHRLPRGSRQQALKRAQGQAAPFFQDPAVDPLAAEGFDRPTDREPRFAGQAFRHRQRRCHFRRGIGHQAAGEATERVAEMSGGAERHGAHIDGRRGRSDRQKAPRFHAGRRAVIEGLGAARRKRARFPRGNRGASSTERRLVETPQLARVQRVELAAQQVEGGDADPQVLVHRALVEGVGRAGQLNLAVQRLVETHSNVP